MKPLLDKMQEVEIIQSQINVIASMLKKTCGAPVDAMLDPGESKWKRQTIGRDGKPVLVECK
jgi:hypothetical protein